MTDILTEEEIQQAKDKHKNPGQYFEEQGHAWDWMWDFNPRAIATIETLQAQNKRLVEALEGIQPFAEACKSHEFNGKYPGKAVYGFNGVNLTFDALNQVAKALSTLPTEALEAEKRREEVIRAAREWYATPGSMAIFKLEGLGDAIKALETLEGGK